MTAVKVLAIGDSVVWGQGLCHNDKFTTLFYRELTGQAWPEEDMLARSGAIVGINIAGEPISPALVPDQQARNEVPFDFPTIAEQVDLATNDRAADIIILDGGINDVLADVFSETDTEDVLDAPIRAACYEEMGAVLHKVRERFPQAVILVLGYFPIVSPCSDFHKSKLYMFIHGNIGLVPDLVAKKEIRNALYFHRRALYWLRRLVTEANQDRGLRGPGILFIHPGFTRKNSIFAQAPYLFEPRSPSNIDAWLLETAGAAITQNWSLLRAKIHEIEPQDADPDISAQRQPACDVVFRDQTGQRIKCWIAPIGHPNRAGARQYANVIRERVEQHRRLSIKENVLRLANQLGPISVRSTLGRYGLHPQDGLRACMQHMSVDCIEVVIKTKNEAFAGTDDDVYLQVGDSWRWLLNEGIFDLEMTNDFEQGSIRTYTIDPVLDSNCGPLHLWDIQEIRLIKKPMWPAGDWKPEWITIRINGLKVFHSQIDTELTHDHPEWLANNPRYPEAL